MKRLLLTVFAALTFAACSSGGTGEKLGIITPTERTVNYDPSTVDGGLAATVGFNVNSPLGDKAWTKYGTGNQAWQTGPQQTTEYDLVIDLTSSTGDKGVIVPARIGETFCPTRWSQLVLTEAGTASGTAPTVSFGVSSAFTNVLAAAAGQTVGQINVGAGQLNNVTVAGSNAALVSNTDIHAAIGTAVTGATTLTVRVALFGYWQAVPF